MRKILSVLILSMSASIHAAQIYNDVDISPMVKHFRKQVVTLNKSITTYNWSPRDLKNQLLDPERPQNDPALLSYGKELAGSFWRGYGSKEGAANMYGWGLYSAVDPVATVDYGGGENWLLTQIQFPVGTRMLDFANAETVNTSDDALASATKDIEEKFGCPRSTSADPYFQNGGFALQPKCQQLIYEVFNTILHVDAFAYGYSGTTFKDCQGGGYVQPRAFVVGSTDWMRSDYIHFYTPKSRLNEEERIRIQTLFLKSVTEAQMDPQPLFDIIASYLDQHPERELESSKTACTGDSCVITVQFCDAKKVCEAVALPPLPRPGGATITSEEAAKTRLLWVDLIGKAKSPTISTWLKDQKFGCTGELPYKIK